MTITQKKVKELFIYENGRLVWDIQKAGVKFDTEAGCINDRGYKQVKINGKIYSVHRLIYLYHHGYLPIEIDHIDGNRLNNDIDNLRSATRSQNSMNKMKSKSMNNKPTSSKYKGVDWRKRTKKWRAKIYINNKQECIGEFINETDAALAYDRMAFKYFNEFGRLNFSMYIVNKQTIGDKK